ncbi:winged helix-turn-helix transcriptional regulator [Candidatus Pacearchaeota archaeon]|nr:winged helix-turn-helix transcriptional regulator [Candidatus Pacearchaeota archaeon]
MKEVVKLFDALSDPTRFKIVEFLLRGEKCVCEIFPHINRTQSTTSIQLKKLVNAGILKSHRQGKKVIYKITDYRVCEIFKILNHATKQVCSPDCCLY